MEWEKAVAIVLGYVGQHFKAKQGINTAVVQGVLAVVALGLYALQTPPSQPYNEWLMDGIMWGLAAIGAASLSAGMGIAPKTDSQTKEAT